MILALVLDVIEGIADAIVYTSWASRRDRKERRRGRQR